MLDKVRVSHRYSQSNMIHLFVSCYRFLPTLAKEVLEREMEKNDILPNFDVATKRLGQITCRCSIHLCNVLSVSCYQVFDV